jgi:hypothetical protein
MKKQIALALAGTAAAIAGGLRLAQELVDRGDHSQAPAPEPASPPAPGPEKPAATAAPSGASKAELYEIATKLDIGGRSKMSKAELIEAINSAA